MTNDLMLEFMVSNNQQHLNDLATEMVKRTKRPWGEIVFAYSWVEAYTQQKGWH